MEELINLHKQDMHLLVEKMKARGKLPPLFAYVASSEIIGGMRAHIAIPVGQILAHCPKNHSDVLTTLFNELLHTEGDGGSVKSSHVVLGLPILSESYAMKDDEWLEFQRTQSDKTLTPAEVEQMATEGKVIFVYLTASHDGFIVTSMNMPGKGEVEFMDTNIQSFEGGKFDATAFKGALARIIDERPHMLDKEKATEDAK